MAGLLERVKVLWDEKRKECVIVICIVAAILVGVVGTIIYNIVKKANQEERYEIYSEMKEENVGKLEEGISVLAERDLNFGRKIDFEDLWETNEDVVAWIYIPGTEVDYPILRSETDDSYYLHHTVDGKEGLPGSIYMEKYNSENFVDYNTILYGHNMKNGTMFGSLKQYTAEEFMDENCYIYIYRPDYTFKYQIFAALDVNDDYLWGNYDFTNQEDYQEFLDYVYENESSDSVIKDAPEVTKDDYILTLSTCRSGQSTHRWLVEAVLIDAELYQ